MVLMPITASTAAATIAATLIRSFINGSLTAELKESFITKFFDYSKPSFISGSCNATYASTGKAR